MRAHVVCAEDREQAKPVLAPTFAVTPLIPLLTSVCQLIKQTLTLIGRRGVRRD